MLMKKLAYFGAIMSALSWGTASLADQPPIELKGLRPGADAGQLLSDAEWRCKTVKTLGADTECINRSETIAGAKPLFILAYLKESRLLAISAAFNQRDFRQVADAFTVKYGPPKEKRIAEKKSRIGAIFHSEQLSWEDGAALLQIEERASKADMSSLVIAGKNGSEAMKKQRAEQAENNKNDL